MATAKAKPTPQPEPFEDGDLVTVLYGYGRVLPTSVTLLDGYTVRGGVIRDVPYGVAKHWQKGTREDGKKVQGRVKVTILPADAPEADFERAAGVSDADKLRMATYMSATDADAILNLLPPDKLKTLRIALDRRLNER